MKALSNKAYPRQDTIACCV